MPIGAAIPILKPAISSAFSMDQAAKASLSAATIMSALLSAVPMGMFPVAPTPIPLVPGGASACKTMIEQAFSLGPAATAEASAQMIATGISILAPTAPPAGLSLLQTQIKQAFSLGQAAKPDMAATMIAAAIPSYYMTGGVL